MIILIGPSASGKTEIAKILISSFGFKKFVTTTTREMRKGEINNVDYHFISKERFEEYKEQNLFIETVCYGKNYYGTYKAEIDNNKVLIVEPTGLQEFLKLNDPSIISFYIDCDEDLRKSRMINRGDKIEDVEARIQLDRSHFGKRYFSQVDFVIENTAETTLQELALKINSLYINKINKKG